MKGVILVPLLAAVLVILMTGSDTAGAVTFLIGLGIAAVLVFDQLNRAAKGKSVTEPLKLWSVTTLLKLGMGTSDPLVNWAVRATNTYALENMDVVGPLYTRDPEAAIKMVGQSRYQKTGKAMARGTELHKAAEALALGVTPDAVDVDALPYVEQFKRFLEDFAPTFHMAEAPVYSPKHYYAGTLDFIMEIDGQMLVVDAKTTDKSPDSGKSRPPYPETALQLVAYRRATEVGVLAERRMAQGKRYYMYDPSGEHSPMPETDGAAVLVVSPFDYMFVPLRTDDEVWRSFLAVREVARWQVDISKRVIGPPVTQKASAA